MASSIHVCMNGEFLVNRMPVSRLPASILEHPVYQRFFGQANFDVLPSSIGPGAYVFQDNKKKSSFTLYRNGADLVVAERRKEQQSSTCHLLPQSLFAGKFPQHLTSSFSYWLNTATRTVEFCPLVFTDYVLEEAVCSYQLDLVTKKLSESVGQRRHLVDIGSTTFVEIATKCTDRLDEREHVHMFVDKKEHVCIQLPRLGLNFYVDTRQANAHRHLDIVSNEYFGMRVSDSQRLDTLIGLRRCLLLSDIEWVDDEHSSRILLVPNGQLSIKAEGRRRALFCFLQFFFLFKSLQNQSISNNLILIPRHRHCKVDQVREGG